MALTISYYNIVCIHDPLIMALTISYYNVVSIYAPIIMALTISYYNIVSVYAPIIMILIPIIRGLGASRRCPSQPHMLGLLSSVV